MRNEKLVSFGQRVREIRKSKGLSQEGMAALAGVDRSYMGHIERGEKNITLTKIYQISEALGIEVADLFPRNEPPRLYRRLHILRGWSYELTKTIFFRSPGASCSISP